MNIYNTILSNTKKGKKQLGVLIDPDKFKSDDVIQEAERSGVDFFLLGGSLLSSDSIEISIERIKKVSKIPIILFPGNVLQINKNADAILFLSLISGRNPELLIGNHVVAAPIIKNANLESISTGYMLVDSGKPTSAQYMSNTNPIPHDKNDIAACTAIAAEMLGMKLIYLDGGSGALNPVSETMIESVKKQIKIPLIVGGGINTIEKANNAFKAGADIIIVGTAIEQNKSFITKLSKIEH